MEPDIDEKKRRIEAVVYPLLLLAIMWLVFLLDKYLHLELYHFGVKPHTIEGLKGVLFMPLIHDEKGFSHILSNSIPISVLLATLIYFYREIALRIFVLVWIGGGILLWIIAKNQGVYHIGMSGVIYGIFGFLLISGFIKRHLPLMAISLIIAFAYGSIIWGVLPLKPGVSWQGHLSGLMIGVFLAFAYRHKGPQPKKYPFEIEEEMGIEPPDFEGMISENISLSGESDEKNVLEDKITMKSMNHQENQSLPKIKMVYHYKPKNKESKK